MHRAFDLALRFLPVFAIGVPPGRTVATCVVPERLQVECPQAGGTSSTITITPTSGSSRAAACRSQCTDRLAAAVDRLQGQVRRTRFRRPGTRGSCGAQLFDRQADVEAEQVLVPDLFGAQPPQVFGAVVPRDDVQLRSTTMTAPRRPRMIDSRNLLATFNASLRSRSSR